MDDEAFRLWVSSALFRSDAGYWIWNQKVLGSTLQRSPKLHANLREYVGTKQIDTPMGTIEMPSLAIPQERAIKYLVRVTKGLLRHYHSSYDYSNDIFSVFHVQQSKSGTDILEDFIRRLVYEARGDRVFRFWRGFAEDVDKSGIWLYSFYDAAWFVVFNRHRDVPFPGNSESTQET